jgi:acyl-CoA thioester hydrolase
VLNDSVHARTWVGTADAIRFERHTEIVRTTDRRILACGRTLWCPINRKSGRLTRVSDDLRRIFSAPAEQDPVA